MSALPLLPQTKLNTAKRQVHVIKSKPAVITTTPQSYADTWNVDGRPAAGKLEGSFGARVDRAASKPATRAVLEFNCRHCAAWAALCSADVARPAATMIPFAAAGCCGESMSLLRLSISAR